MVDSFDRGVQYLVICVHSENIFLVIANLPALQHNVGSLIKQRPNHQKQRILRLNPNMKKLRQIFNYITLVLVENVQTIYV